MPIDFANVTRNVFMGISQIFGRGGKEQEPENKVQSYQPEVSDTAHPGPDLSDKLALSAQIVGQPQSQNLKTISEERTPSPLRPGNGLAAEKSGHILESGAAEAEGLEESAGNSRVLPGFEQTLREAGNQAPGLGSLLHTWMQADPKTLTGLRSFLEVESSHYSADPQTFQTFQLISMLREARQLLEEQKLRTTTEDPESANPSEEAEKALLGASLMGYAYYVLRRKNLKERAAVDLKSGMQDDSLASELSLCLDEVFDYLKKAEAGLERAMAQGADNRRLRLLIHKVLDVCADIVQLKRELAGTQQLSA